MTEYAELVEWSWRERQKSWE